MVSEKKLEANRKNAAKSTGPRTREGKMKAAMNAITHGIFVSKYPILPNENEQDYLQLHADIVRDLQPTGAIQRELVDDIVQTRWRMRRVTKMEAQRMLKRQHQRAREHVSANEFYLTRPDPPDLDPSSILSYHGPEEDLDLYRDRLQRMFHTQLRELRKLRGETGQNEANAALPRDTGLRPVRGDVQCEKERTSQVKEVQHGPETRVTVSGKNEPTAEHKSAGERRLENRRDVLSSAVNVVADSLMLSMDDLTEVQRSVEVIDRPKME